MQCEYNERKGQANICNHPQAETCVGKYPDPAVCSLCISKSNGTTPDPRNLFSAPVLEKIAAEKKRQQIICKYRGEMVERGSCACGDGDIFLCNYPPAAINGKPPRTRRKDCAVCKHNAAAEKQASA